MESGNELTAHLTTGAVAVYMIEWLKRQEWCPWLDVDTGTVNRIVSLGAAVIAVMGISFTYDPQVGGTIHIPSLAVLMAGAWEVAKQFTTQQLLWDGVVAPKQMRVKEGGPA